MLRSMIASALLGVRQIALQWTVCTAGRRTFNMSFGRCSVSVFWMASTRAIGADAFSTPHCMQLILHRVTHGERKSLAPLVARSQLGLWWHRPTQQQHTVPGSICCICLHEHVLCSLCSVALWQMSACWRSMLCIAVIPQPCALLE